MDSMSGGARKLKRLIAGSFGLCGIEARWIDEAVAAAGHSGRRCYWMPVVTIMTFLRQILLGNCSCRSAVAGTLSAGPASDLSADAASGADDKSYKDPGFFGVSGDPSAYAQASGVGWVRLADPTIFEWGVVTEVGYYRRENGTVT